jgi:hypothetical protein
VSGRYQPKRNSIRVAHEEHSFAFRPMAENIDVACRIFDIHVNLVERAEWLRTMVCLFLQ